MGARALVALVVVGLISAAALRPPARLPQFVRAAAAGETPEAEALREEARIRKNLEAYSTARPTGRHRRKRRSPAAARRRRARGASFEDAQTIGAALGAQIEADRASGAETSVETRALLRNLVSTTAGARGWFVAMLTDPAFAALFEEPVAAPIVDEVAARPEPNVRLVVMNVAMSAAAAVAHDAAGHADLAAAARDTRDRSSRLLKALLPRMPGLGAAASQAAVSARGDRAAPPDDGDDEWRAFLAKWGYDAAQRAAIAAALADAAPGD